MLIIGAKLRFQASKIHCLNNDEVSIKIVSYNILAPCYNKIKTFDNNSMQGFILLFITYICLGVKRMESDFEYLYVERHKEICNRLKSTNADVICIQEFWCANERLRDLYRSELGTSTTNDDEVRDDKKAYTLKELRRTNHWLTNKKREDGVAIFVRNKRLVSSLIPQIPNRYIQNSL